MLPAAIRNAVLSQQISASFVPVPDTKLDFTAADLSRYVEEGVEMARSNAQEYMQQVARWRMEQISIFAAEMIRPHIEGGDTMSEGELVQAAQDAGFRIVCAVLDTDEPGVESVVIYLGAEMLAGMKLRLFPASPES